MSINENSKTIRVGDRMYEVYFGDGKMSLIHGQASLTAPYEDWAEIQKFLWRRFTRKERQVREDAPTNQGQPWTEELDAALVMRWDEGASVTEISLEFDRSERSIMARLSKFDLLSSAGYGHLRKATAPVPGSPDE